MHGYIHTWEIINDKTNLPAASMKYLGLHLCFPVFDDTAWDCFFNQPVDIDVTKKTARLNVVVTQKKI